MAQVNVPSFLAGLLRSSGDALYKACAKMPADRLSWHPKPEETDGRDALDQIAECAYLNRWAANAVQAGSVPAFDGAAYKAGINELKANGKALEEFKAGTEAFAAAIGALSADQVGETITNPITGQPATWADFALFFYWNNVYHEGQVNYIQVLYGDLD